MTNARIGTLAAEALLLAAMTALLFATMSILHLKPGPAAVAAVALVAAGRALVALERRVKARRRTAQPENGSPKGQWHITFP